MITLIARDGYVYTNGEISCKKIVVSDDKAEEFYEISEEEAIGGLI